MAGRGNRLDSLKTRRIAGGLTIGELARRAAVSDLTVKNIENGGACGPDEMQRILDALAPSVAITSNSQANPTEVTCASAHNLVTGDTVVIAGVATSNANPNGTRVVTVTTSTKFTVPVNATTAAGTGGTVTIDKASVGHAQL